MNTMKHTLLALLLTGCAAFGEPEPQWYVDKPGYRVTSIKIEQDADYAKRCGVALNVGGCAFRLNAGPEGPYTLVILPPGLDDKTWGCRIVHEARHAAGQNHRSPNSGCGD